MLRKFSVDFIFILYYFYAKIYLDKDYLFQFLYPVAHLSKLELRLCFVVLDLERNFDDQFIELQLFDSLDFKFGCKSLFNSIF